MKSFFQLSEQVKKHQRRKLLREADGDATNKEAEPVKAQGNMAMQNNQGDNQPKSVSYAEIPDIDLVTEFQKKLDTLAKDKANAAALVKMKEIPSTQAFATAFTNAQAELQKAVATMQAEDQEEKSGKKPGDSGSNTAGSGAGATTTPTPATPPGTPAQTGPAPA